MSFKVEGSSRSNICSVYVSLAAAQACLLVLGSVLEEVPLAGGSERTAANKKCT